MTFQSDDSAPESGRSAAGEFSDDPPSSAVEANHGPSIVAFFVGVFALSIPFWVVGAIADVELLPGLPVSSLMIVAPLGSALILTYRERGGKGALALLRRSFDHRRIQSPGWYVLIVLIFPIAFLATFAAQWALNRPLPAPDVMLSAAPALLVVFFISALAEELGWSGYALDPMQRRWGPLSASLLLGTIWAVWHVVPLVQVGRDLEWIVWWSLYAVASRVVYTWVYNGTERSVFAVALLHAMANLSWQLFPNDGSHWDAQIGGLVLTLMAVVVVAAKWPGSTFRTTPAQDRQSIVVP